MQNQRAVKIEERYVVGNLIITHKLTTLLLDYTRTVSIVSGRWFHEKDLLDCTRVFFLNSLVLHQKKLLS